MPRLKKRDLLRQSIKLKKKTKTYADKKASKNKDGSTAQLEEDEEVKEVSCFKRTKCYFRPIYNFVAGSAKKQQQGVPELIKRLK
ncbi:CFC_HP_G0025100.mRNA.1.CDS.1 [Saccharomyces cerevisiae]|nr:CFC_HP_G0025100.mRNA.1.CDS.1 [Saccharomyces cerevisiae]CAI6944627.1 CFC_HP_G0025100.mRNA.1.CDS.1 [Saccharomyces cerevisiae]